MEQSSTLGVIVVGTGFVADSHLAALRSRADAHLVGVVDVAPERAAATARAQGGVRWSTDLAEALSWPGVAAAIVCTPNDTHSALARQIAGAGCHLLIEKPLATSVADARAAADAFATAGRVLAVAHTHRCYDYARAVRRAITSGEVGRPRLVRLSVLGGWIWPDWRGWMLDGRRSGGHALHNGVHLLDVVTWWIGCPPVSVFARGHKQTSSELDIYDHLEMVVRFEGGAVAVCEMSRGHRPATLAMRDVFVQGTAGLLTLPWDADASLLIDERGPGLLPTVASDGFARQLDAWLAALHGTAPPVDGHDGVLAVALGVAAERSIVAGAPVSVADVLATEPREVPA
ncbi:Gfo/Idh/MocA family oxidoreductase [Micromonospora sp. DR5-3]|uniref:Gfo/Idh/MocA family protein n=1 Tax=unclassified Micromonospora TaxID=2617518 RepID=UPI0011D60BAB|nr:MULTISPECIES: Gfo/Idh/MocA family oxidoreductase [unclassified Micromonospora]MCW3818909.1 Gfo/Idh/MocA family oxidoreductase [Micromonospora sp. DR5-3]TYC20933.1 Gfo/Idh/MocA family oxidoreductase [Micromonospora sp. MP36]